jgi:hypothetical protein
VILRWPLVVGLFVLTPVVGAVAVHDCVLATRFARLSFGMYRQNVVEVMGTPRFDKDCDAAGPFKGWLPHCAEVYVYSSWGQPLVPSAWVVWFDGEGKAIGKYRFVSW